MLDICVALVNTGATRLIRAAGVSVFLRGSSPSVSSPPAVRISLVSKTKTKKIKQ